MTTDEGLVFIRRLLAAFPVMAKYARENSPDLLATTNHWLEILRPFEQVEAEYQLGKWVTGFPDPARCIADPMRVLREAMVERRRVEEVRAKSDAQVFDYKRAKQRRTIAESMQFDPGTKEAYDELEHIWKRYQAGEIAREGIDIETAPRCVVDIIAYGKQFGTLTNAEYLEAKEAALAKVV